MKSLTEHWPFLKHTEQLSFKDLLSFPVQSDCLEYVRRTIEVFNE